jgi:hypothetical protein
MEKDNKRQDREAKQILLSGVESEMEKCEELLLQLYKPGNMGVWTSTVSKYHALCIKRCLIKGEQPAVIHGRSDYII